jgi:hypothetical protein
VLGTSVAGGQWLGIAHANLETWPGRFETSAKRAAACRHDADCLTSRRGAG